MRRLLEVVNQAEDVPAIDETTEVSLNYKFELEVLIIQFAMLTAQFGGAGLFSTRHRVRCLSSSFAQEIYR